MSTEVDIKYVGDEKNEMRDSFHICLIFFTSGLLAALLGFL